MKHDKTKINILLQMIYSELEQEKPTYTFIKDIAIEIQELAQEMNKEVK